MRAILATGMVAILFGTGAHADTLVASRPGLMCTSADALAILTLPDGSDRATSPRARPGDLATEREGGCIPIPRGARVSVQTARRNTSIVTYDAGDGRGARSFVAPNVDFGSSPAGLPAAGCLDYDVPVSLTGRITSGAAYGEDLHTGQVGWTRWRQITLDRPICTRGNSQALEDPERGVRAIQPVFLNGDVRAHPLGEHVTVVGKLFHRDNGNQMTAVLIEVASMTSEH